MPDGSVASALRDALAGLPLEIERADSRSATVILAGYPDDGRPTSTVTLHGRGQAGRGEDVGWTATAHARFREDLAALPVGRHRLGAWAEALRGRFADPYDRAALEAAAIDLALRQAATTPFALANVAAPAAIRYVVSCGRLADPAADAEPDVELKLDVDPGWSDPVWTRLAALGRVVVLDLKGGVGAARAHRALPEALLEDPAPENGTPWPPSLRRRVSVDAAVESAADLDALPITPAAVNLKPARMGGVLELLDAAARCAARGIPVYVGGMWETGIGRRQLWVLAALLSPDGPNDVAPLARPTTRPPRLQIDAHTAGFGG